MKKNEELVSELNEYKGLNKELRSYITDLEDGMIMTDPTQFINSGKKIRKIKQLTTNVERALWFLNSFGLKLGSLTLVQSDKETQNVQLKFNGEKGGTKSIFSQLNEEDKDKLRSVLFIMDRFCISDAAYHKLSMQVGELQRSYLVRQCRNNLNQLFHITRTPGHEPGVQMSFKKELQYQLEQVRKLKNISNTDNK